MTFEQLDFLIAAAEHPTFLDAAESLHISQSSLSKQIRKMEQELNIALFDRSQRKACLTEAGTYIYREALRLNAEYRQVLAGLSAYRQTDSRTLRIGTLPILAQYGLNVFLKDFASSHPDLSLSIEEAEETDLYEGLEQNRYDLVLAREILFDPELHAVTPIIEDELVAALPASHALARRQAVSLSQLAGEPFLLMKPYTSVYTSCMNAIKKAGIQICLLRTARIESILSSVAVGEGVGLLARKNFEVFRHTHVVPVPLDPPVTLPVAAGRKKGARTKAGLTELTAFLRQAGMER